VIYGHVYQPQAPYAGSVNCGYLFVLSLIGGNTSFGAERIGCWQFVGDAVYYARLAVCVFMTDDVVEQLTITAYAVERTMSNRMHYSAWFTCLPAAHVASVNYLSLVEEHKGAFRLELWGPEPLPLGLGGSRLGAK